MSIGQEFINANEFSPWLDSVSREEQISGELAREAAQKFIDWVDANYPNEFYACRENAALLEKFLEINDVCPAHLRNYKIAFVYLRSENLLVQAPESDEPEEIKTKHTGPIIQRILKSPEELEAERAETARLRALDANSPRSQKKIDVGQDLRAAYIESRNANRNGGRKRHMTEAAARAQIAIQMPHLKIGSPEYNMWTARLQFVQDNDYQE